MRHLNLFIAICASTALLASCAKEMQKTEKTASSFNWNDIVIEGTQAESDLTKTSVDGTTGKVYWSPGDRIAVFIETARLKYVAQNTEKAATTIFTSSSSVIIGSTEGFSAKDQYDIYGLYPYDSYSKSDGSTITTTLDSYQYAAEGTFADDIFISIGKATTSNPAADWPKMEFYNVCGGVRFSVTTEGITEVTFKGNNDEVLAGEVKLVFGEDNIPVVSEVVDGKKEVTLTCSGEGFKPGVMYYITTLPVTLTKGYTMTFETDYKKGTLSTDSQVTVKRSVFGTLDNADGNIVWKNTKTGIAFQPSVQTFTTKGAVMSAEFKDYQDRTMQVSGIYCQNGEFWNSYDFFLDRTFSKESDGLWHSDPMIYYPLESPDKYCFLAFSSEFDVRGNWDRGRVNVEVDTCCLHDDILYAAGVATGIEGTPVELKFNHAQALVTFNVKTSNNVEFEKIIVRRAYIYGNLKLSMEDFGVANATWSYFGIGKWDSFEVPALYIKEGKFVKSEVNAQGVMTLEAFFPADQKPSKIEVYCGSGELVKEIDFESMENWQAGGHYVYDIDLSNI